MRDYRTPAEAATRVSTSQPPWRGWLRRIFGRWKAPPEPLRPAESFYNACIRLARDPALFRDGGVPDTLDGRFDALALVVSLAMLRLEAADDVEAAMRAGWQSALVERLVDDMDRSLREIGVGDMNVGKQVRSMAAAFSGRHLAYRAALDAGDAVALLEALGRNLYRGKVPVPERQAFVAGWIAAVRTRLAGCSTQDLMEGRL